MLDSDEASYERLFAVNVKGMFFVMQAVLKDMVAAGVKGSVINLASQAGRRGEALVSHYCATKAAVISYTQSAALAMAPHGIRVNGIAPGVVDTPMWAHVDALFAKHEHLATGREEEGGWPGRAAGPHGTARRHRRRRGLPGQRRSALHHCADIERGWRQRHVLTHTSFMTARDQHLPRQRQPELEHDYARSTALGYEPAEDTGFITCLAHGFPTPLARWHFHDEYELHLITATSGKAFIGDWIGPFQPGHLVLCGPRLPHNWISMDVPYGRCR